VTIWLGQNDRGNYTESQYAAAIGQLVARIKGDMPSSKILLIGTYNSGDPRGWMTLPTPTKLDS